MLVLLATAIVGVGSAGGQPVRDGGAVIVDRPAPTARTTASMPNLYRAPAHCSDQRREVVDRFGRPVLLPLGRLPTPSLQLTVDRRVDGCPVVTVARGYQPPPVDQPNPPNSQYRIEPLYPRR